jgi:putative ABC transport system permease protein
MMSGQYIAYRKVWRDLWTNKGRTILVVVSIAVGVMAIGMIFATNRSLSRQMQAAQIASHPSHVKAYLDKGIDDELLKSIARMPGIEDAEGAIELSIRWKTDVEGDWSTDYGTLIARQDYEHQKYDILTLKQGFWPSTKRVAVEFNHTGPFDIPPLDGTVYFEVNERAVAYKTSGTLRDPSQFPPPNTPGPAFYVTRSDMERLTNERDFNLLRFRVPQYSEANAQAALETVQTRLKKLGIEITYYEIQDPTRHPMQDVINGVGLVLALMAVMSLLLSTLLVINTVNAIIAQQIPQIGVMKAIGGIRGIIARLYLAGVTFYGFFSLVVAVPMGAIGGYFLSNWMLYLLNVPSGSFGFQPISMVYQFGAGLILPLLVTLYPVFRGASITVREAISSYGLGDGAYGTGLVDRLLGRIRGLPRLAALPLRNTFRRIGRALLTELTLVSAGALFLTVLSTGHSVSQTISKAWESFGFDVLLVFEQPQRIDEVLSMMQDRPGIAHSEMWVWVSAKTRLPGTTGLSAEHDIALRGFPTVTDFFKPEIVAGQMPASPTERQLLLNQKLARDMGVGVGDLITIDLGGGRESTWAISGLILDLTKSQETGYMYRDALNEELGQVNRASVAEIKLTGDKATNENAQNEAIKDLQNYFDSQKMKVSVASSAIQEQQAAAGQLSILITILLVMTVLVAIVGSVGLSGTLSINVIERIREIGVMRAVGASSSDIGLIFVGEGLILGLISWLISIPISVFAARLFVQVLGQVVDISVQYTYSISGVITWLIIVAILSLLASWLPAMHAARISVARSLAYE